MCAGSSLGRAPDNETINHHCDSPRAADAKSPPDKSSPRFGGVSFQPILTPMLSRNFVGFSPPIRAEIVFCSNRNGAKQGDTNVLIADWVE